MSQEIVECSWCGDDKVRIAVTKADGKVSYRDEKGKSWLFRKCPACYAESMSTAAPGDKELTHRKCRQCSARLPKSRYFTCHVCVENLPVEEGMVNYLDVESVEIDDLSSLAFNDEDMEFFKYKKSSEETKLANMSQGWTRARRVACSDGTIYNSAKDAARHTRLDFKTIHRRCLDGRSTRTGLTFKFLSNEGEKDDQSKEAS